MRDAVLVEIRLLMEKAFVLESCRNNRKGRITVLFAYCASVCHSSYF
jgi:hypothetical protein